MEKKKIKIKKRELLSRILIEKEGRPKTFWQKEMTLLNRLIKEFGESDFWNYFTLDKKVDSVAILTCDFYKNLIDQRIKQFHFELKEAPKEIKLEEKALVEPKRFTKAKTVRDFLS